MPSLKKHLSHWACNQTYFRCPLITNACCGLAGMLAPSPDKKCTSTAIHGTFSLTHWGWDKMAAFFQTTCSDAFSWIKMYQLRLKFHCSLFAMVQLTTFQHWIRWLLGADQATSHYLKQWWVVYWCLYASLGLNELEPKADNSYTVHYKIRQKNWENSTFHWSCAGNFSSQNGDHTKRPSMGFHHNGNNTHMINIISYGIIQNMEQRSSHRNMFCSMK